MRPTRWPLVLSLAAVAVGGGLPMQALAAPHTDQAAQAEEVVAPPAPPAPEAVDDLPVQARDADGVWAWMERLDGEVPDAAMQAALAERIEEDLVERAVIDETLGLDVPLDFYRNPERALLGDPLHLEDIDPSEFDIPIVVNAEVEKWMRILLGPSRKYMQRWLERRSRYEALIFREADKAGLPRDLLYLSMIESGFSPQATSTASAAGLWQFIQGTGRMYGLQVDFWVDERRDPEKATVASMKMLGELHRRFGDWYLAWAAYNTGPARVGRNIARLEAEGLPTDFWTMLERGMLHSETSGYVPKIVAAAILGKHPERYGLQILEPLEPLAYDTITLDHAVDLSVLATCAGVDEETLRALNPALRRYALPEGGQDVRLPLGSLAAFEEAYAKVPPEERRQVVMHVVRSGESLSKIAMRYGVSMSAVAAANSLRNVNALTVGQQLVIPLSGASAVAVQEEMRAAPAVAKETKAAPAPSAKPESTQADTKKTTPSTHTVRAGDALSVLAERYGVSMAELQRLNGLAKPDDILVGQVLKLGSGGGSADAEPAAPAASEKKVTRYTVKSGDTLSEIAERFGVSQADLQRTNGISRASAIQVGQVLKVEAAADGWTSHTVRKGESLGLIAESYGVAVDDLKGWNGLKGSTIYPGDTLKVRKR